MTPSILKNNYIKITLKKYTYKFENILITPFCTKNNCAKNSHPKHTHKPYSY